MICFFSLTNPLVSLPNLFYEFELYSLLSNLKMYFGKSEAMGVEPSPLLQSLEIEFHVQMDGLGPEIFGHIYPSPVYLNLILLLSWPKLVPCLETWHQGLHLWFGRCNLKMWILPKHLYIFQALPIRIPSDYFKKVHSLFINFVWAHNSLVFPIVNSLIFQTIRRPSNLRYLEILPGNSFL